jgi:DNA-binding CsgD family transcriptional regulator
MPQGSVSMKGTRPSETSAPTDPEGPVVVPAAVCSACGAVRSARLPLDQGESVPHGAPTTTIAGALQRIPALTPRERTTFELLGLGYDNRSIARLLEISERTTKRHVTAILSKLKLESRLQAGLAALIVTSFASAAARWPEGRMDPAFDAGDTSRCGGKRCLCTLGQCCDAYGMAPSMRTACLREG